MPTINGKCPYTLSFRLRCAQNEDKMRAAFMMSGQVLHQFHGYVYDLIDTHARTSVAQEQAEDDARRIASDLQSKNAFISAEEMGMFTGLLVQFLTAQPA
jgi:hypothetical protein